MMENKNFIETDLSQLRWEEYNRGYSHVNEITKLKEKLYKIREGELPFKFTDNELKLLTISIHNSMTKICNYDYKDLDGVVLREEALHPLHEFQLTIDSLAI